MYLRDIHILVWVLTRPERLSRAALEAVQTGPVAVSVASFWEMVNKKLGPLFPIRFAHVAQVEAMNWPHQDPYDRILSAQAIVEQATLVTADTTILAHAGVPTLW